MTRHRESVAGAFWAARGIHTPYFVAKCVFSDMSADSDRSPGSRSLFDGLHDLADALHSVADEARSFEHSISLGEGSGEMRVEVRTNIGGVADTTETTEQTATTARAAADEAQEEGRPVRRPVVDVEEEADQVRVVAEMPGVTADVLEWDVEGRALSLDAPTERVRYARVVELPALVNTEEATVTVEAGIVTVVLPRRPDDE